MNTHFNWLQVKSNLSIGRRYPNKSRMTYFSNNFQRIFVRTTLRALCELIEFCTLSFCFSCNFIAKKQQLTYQSCSRNDKWMQYWLMSLNGWLETSSSATTELQRQAMCIMLGQYRPTSIIVTAAVLLTLLAQTSDDSTLLLEIYDKLGQTRCIFHAFVKSPILRVYLEC